MELPLLLLFSGVPAAGKTVLSVALQSNLGAFSLSLDEILSSLGDFSPAIWRQAQNLLFSATERAIENRLFLIVVDDNMNYVSMVKKYRRLARTWGYGFLHIVLKVSLETAKARNGRRLTPVPEDVIAKMWRQMEKQSFLSDSIEIQEGNSDQIFLIVKDLIQTARLKVLNEVPVPDDETDRNRSGEDPIHRADLYLRSMINETIHLTAPDLKPVLGKELGKVKAAILQVLREDSDLSLSEAEQKAAEMYVPALAKVMKDLQKSIAE